MRVGIVGGGLTGLCAAYTLAQRGHQVTVLERGGELGGQMSTFNTPGEPLERFYHHIFTSDTQFIALVQELGLGPRLVWLDSKVGFFHGGKIYKFVTPGDLLRFSPIGLTDRVRLGLLGMYLRRAKDWRRWEGVTAREWIIRNAGRRNFDVVWGPLLRGKFGASADEIGMPWFWGKIHLRFASRKGLGQRESLGYMMGGFAQVADALAQRIRQAGGEVHTGQEVRRVTVAGGRATGVEVAGRLGERHLDFDAVIATVPSFVALRIAPELSGDYALKLSQGRYQAAVCLVLLLRQRLTPIYWLNISDATVPFVAAIEHTNFVGPEHYGGRHVLYLSNYLAPTEPLAQASREELLEAYLPHLSRLNPGFRPDWVEATYLFNDPSGQPIITTHYSRLVPDLRTPIPGLFLANTTQIYPEDRGLNQSVGLARQVASLV
ncbi:MAG: NAD(P)/FAD-dependent oxidoreductase [Chloroflexi bacterium]|nr:NAD(P)/FAD-dependent oxidoreductase [Chloroflexota bacterium]